MILWVPRANTVPFCTITRISLSVLFSSSRTRSLSLFETWAPVVPFVVETPSEDGSQKWWCEPRLRTVRIVTGSLGGEEIDCRLLGTWARNGVVGS